MSSATTIIVGGVAGGMSTATRLRRRDADRTIIVFEAGDYVSFANCGLPYYVGGVIERRSELLLQTPESLWARFALDVRVGHRVTAINREAQTVTVTRLSDGAISEHHYDDLVLSPGASPIVPPIPGIERGFTLRTVEDVDRIVSKLSFEIKTAAILGAGFIGLELAENLKQWGYEVTIVDLAPQVLTPVDAEMAAIVAEHLESKGVHLVLGAEVTEATDKELILADGSVIPADVLFVAIGVAPESTLAKDAGLELTTRGAIKVDDHQRTSDPNIYALGDAAAKTDAIDGADALIPLAQTANRHGRLVADVITGRDEAALPVLGTAIVGVFDLTVGTVGWNERRARAAGLPLRVVHIHPVNHAGYYPGAAQMHLKLLGNAETDAIVGAQAVGKEGVDKRIDVIATAMRAGLRASDLADLELAYAPQYGSAKDPINMAGFVNDNLAQGEGTVQWHELEREIAGEAGEEETILLDVRTPGEYAAGHIPGAQNWQVDELRHAADITEKLGGKRVFVYCQVGLRGHIATTLLAGRGVVARNLDGGYLTWKYGKLSEQLAGKSGN